MHLSGGGVELLGWVDASTLQDKHQEPYQPPRRMETLERKRRGGGGGGRSHAWEK